MAKDYSFIDSYLLHNSYLEHIWWNEKKKEIIFRFNECLRKNLDGTMITDLHVNMKFKGMISLSGCVIKWDTKTNTKNSELTEQVEPDISIIKNGIETNGGYIIINNKNAIKHIKEENNYRFFYGKEKKLDKSVLNVVFSLNGDVMGVGREYQVLFLLICKELAVFDENNRSLTLDLWKKQNEKWWKDWEKEAKNLVEDDQMIIPSGEKFDLS